MKKKTLLSIILTVVMCIGVLSPLAVYAKPNKPDNTVNSVGLSKSSVTLTVGDVFTLRVSVKPNNASIKSLAWSSSNTSVATVSAGRITALAAGKSRITATAMNGRKATCNVTVKPDPSSIAIDSIRLSDKSVALATSDIYTLSAAISPSNAANTALTWTSSDTNVASVSSKGTVIATGTGTATITASSANGKTASCIVTVYNPADTVDSIEALNINTTVGTPPVLPTTVTADLSDGTTKAVAVTWNSIDASKYAKAGTFKVSGTITESSSIKAIAVVKVVTPSIATPGVVKQNTTITQNQTVNGDLIIAPNVTFTVKSGASLVVIGNIYVYGEFDNFGSLTDNGTLYTNNYNNALFGNSTLSTGKFLNRGKAYISFLTTTFPNAYSPS